METSASFEARPAPWSYAANYGELSGPEVPVLYQKRPQRRN